MPSNSADRASKKRRTTTTSSKPTASVPVESRSSSPEPVVEELPRKKRTAPSTAPKGILKAVRPVQDSSDSEPEAPAPNNAADDDSDADPEDRYESAEESEEDDDSGADSDDSLDEVLAAQGEKKKKKSKNAATFSTSMSKILGSHISNAKKSDPVLVRAKLPPSESAANPESIKAKKILKEERRKEKERGRVKDVVGRRDAEVMEGEDSEDEEERGLRVKRALEKERMLKGVARSGVARLFNAVRAAQMKAEEAGREVRKSGVVGMKQREEKVNEMSKQGFLELISSGGKK